MRSTPSTLPSTSSSRTSELFHLDRRPKPDLGKWTNFSRFLCNRQKGTCCNRTCEGWVKLLLFYFIFMTIVFGVFFGMLYLWIVTVKETGTPWIDKKELLDGAIPGLGIVPSVGMKKSPLIWYTFSGTEETYNLKPHTYIRHLKRYFQKYTNAANEKDKYSTCPDSKEPGKPCLFDITELGECGSDNNYGYESRQPCFFVKINKLPGWTPEYFEDNEVFPADMPEKLQDSIKQATDKKKLWLHCKGLNPHDQEHLGDFSYYPFEGFMGHYFPYESEDNYLSPLVAVRAANMEDGFDLNLECSIWAKNVNNQSPTSNSANLHIYIAKDLTKTNST